MNLTKEEQERLIEVKERGYVDGVRIISAFLKGVHIIQGDPFIGKDNDIYCTSKGKTIASITFGSQWAEILPNESPCQVHEGEEVAKITTSTYGGKLFVLPEGYDLDMIAHLKSYISRLE